MGADMTVDENGLTPEVQTLEGTGGQRTKLGTPEATTEVETETSYKDFVKKDKELNQKVERLEKNLEGFARSALVEESAEYKLAKQEFDTAFQELEDFRAANPESRTKQMKEVWNKAKAKPETETETTTPMKEKLEMQELNNIKASLRKKKGFGKDSFAYQVIDELSKSMKDENYEVSLDNQELIETVEFLAEEGVTLQNIRNIIAEEGVEGLETNQEIENYFINIGKAQKLTQGVLPRLAGIKPKAETKTEETLPPNIVVAPYFNTTINTLEDAKKLRENEDYKAYKETLVELGKDMGIEVQVEESIGGYENDAGEKIVEISNKVVL